MEEEVIKYTLDEQGLKALFEGKKLAFEYEGQPRFEIYPPRYGVFMTHGKYAEMEKMAMMKCYKELLDMFAKISEEQKKVIKHS